MEANKQTVNKRWFLVSSGGWEMGYYVENHGAAARQFVQDWMEYAGEEIMLGIATKICLAGVANKLKQVRFCSTVGLLEQEG